VPRGSARGSRRTASVTTYATQLIDAGASLRDVQIGARHADPRITMRYDRARLPLDRQVNYVLATRVAGSI
jgi:hypothetical protein